MAMAYMCCFVTLKEVTLTYWRIAIKRITEAAYLKWMQNRPLGRQDEQK